MEINPDRKFNGKIQFQSCHKCLQAFEETDIVILNAEGDDLDLMKERAVLRKTRQKKSKKKKLDDDVSVEEKKTDEAAKKKMKKEDKVIPTLSNNHKKADDPAYKKAKSDYSVAKDPKASEVFKSIFTTHKSAAEQDRAHWVTYNPFYN